MLELFWQGGMDIFRADAIISGHQRHSKTIKTMDDDLRALTYLSHMEALGWTSGYRYLTNGRHVCL